MTADAAAFMTGYHISVLIGGLVFAVGALFALFALFAVPRHASEQEAASS